MKLHNYEIGFPVPLKWVAIWSIRGFQLHSPRLCSIFTLLLSLSLPTLSLPLEGMVWSRSVTDAHRMLCYVRVIITWVARVEEEKERVENNQEEEKQEEEPKEKSAFKKQLVEKKVAILSNQLLPQREALLDYY